MLILRWVLTSIAQSAARYMLCWSSINFSSESNTILLSNWLILIYLVFQIRNNLIWNLFIFKSRKITFIYFPLYLILHHRRRDKRFTGRQSSRLPKRENPVFPLVPFRSAREHGIVPEASEEAHESYATLQVWQTIRWVSWNLTGPCCHGEGDQPAGLPDHHQMTIAGKSSPILPASPARNRALLSPWRHRFRKPFSLPEPFAMQMPVSLLSCFPRSSVVSVGS